MILLSLSIRVAEGGALAHWLPDVEKNEANAFVCVYLMVQLLELEPSFSLFHSVLQTFGHCILHIHRCRPVTVHICSVVDLNPDPVRSA